MVIVSCHVLCVDGEIVVRVQLPELAVYDVEVFVREIIRHLRQKKRKSVNSVYTCRLAHVAELLRQQQPLTSLMSVVSSSLARVWRKTVNKRDNYEGGGGQLGN